MGPYCHYCQSRCFVPIPADAPAAVRAAFGTATLMATCATGQAHDKQATGYCYADVRLVVAG